MDRLIAGVEIGGTKTIVILARGREIVAMRQVATTSPSETLGACSQTLERWQSEHGAPAALGIGSFGPLNLEGGRITNTPKPGWSGTDVVGHFSAFGLPVHFDTDVNAAALAEHLWGASRGTRVSLYMTIGTGIGAGVIVDGKPVHGLVHPELGHVRTRPDDSFPGICPFHGDCLEGVASGPAIASRTGQDAATLEADDPIWSKIAYAIGDVLATAMLMISPERIVLGGGVGVGRPQLLQLVQDRIVKQLNGYVSAVTPTSIRDIVRTAELAGVSGPLGATALTSSPW